MLHFIDERQFNAVTLELDSQAHFAARVPAGNVFATAPNTASWITRANLSYRCLRRLGQREPPTPTQEISLVEQLVISGPGIRGAAGYFWFRKTRSFFSANVYLWPASVMSFKRSRPLRMAPSKSPARSSGTYMENRRFPLRPYSA